jgi:hypothetical protein
MMKGSSLTHWPLPVRRTLKGYCFCAVMAFALLASAGRAWAQGIERESLAGEGAADALRQSEDEASNLQLGPVNIRAAASVTSVFNDNINLAKDGREADVIISPSAGITADWKITDLNSLKFNLGLTYEAYLDHSNDDALVISPDSELEFNLFVGDVKLHFYDNFSYQNDPVAVGQISNTAQFDRFNNVAGVRADWDLGDMIVSADFNHTNFWVFSVPYKYLTYEADTISPMITFKITPSIEAGLMTSFSDTRYNENVQPDQDSVSVGPYVSVNLTENISMNAGAGFYYGRYGTGALNGDPTSNNASYYANFSINHRVNDVLNESFSAGRETILGVNTDYTDRIFANYTMGWQATSYINLGANLWWENLEDSPGPFHETANRYGIGLSLSYNLMEHLSTTLSYNFVLKDANPSLYSYYDDVLTFGLSYNF